jgi:hypothetical protein
VDSCAVCGFVWAQVDPSEVGARVTAAAAELARPLGEPRVARRPLPARWSALEYGAHVRDVLLSQRERVVLACVVENPTGQPIYRAERVDLGFYRRDTTVVVASELVMAGALLARTFAAVPADMMSRPLRYSPVTPLEVDVAWVGAQAVHECEHHLADVRENLAEDVATGGRAPRR